MRVQDDTPWAGGSSGFTRTPTSRDLSSWLSPSCAVSCRQRDHPASTPYGSEVATRRVDKGTHQPLLPPPPPPPPEKPPPPKELPPPNPVPTAPDEEGTGVAAEVRLLVKNAVLNAAI